jgi:hypothetical protein
MNRDEAICVVRGIKDGTARADTLEGDFGRVVEAIQALRPGLHSNIDLYNVVRICGQLCLALDQVDRFNTVTASMNDATAKALVKQVAGWSQMGYRARVAIWHLGGPLLTQFDDDEVIVAAARAIIDSP